MPEFEQKQNRIKSDRLPRSTRAKYSTPHLARLTLTASPEQPQTERAAPASPGMTAIAHPLPYTAVLLEARIQIENCRVPQGRFGASRVARIRIFDFNGRPVNRVMTVSERFTRIEDPENVFRRLQPASKSTNGQGFFNDCYLLFQPGPFPSDFRLKVEQNHLLGTEVISRNHITYTPDNIQLCVFRRAPRQRDFGSRCRFF